MSHARALSRILAAAVLAASAFACKPEDLRTPSQGGSVRAEVTDDTPAGILPYVKVVTDDWTPVTSKERYLEASLTLEDANKIYTGEAKSSCFVYIKGRGKSSWGQPKKPYRLKFVDGRKMFGMHKDKGWILIANYSDKSLVRNLLATRLSKILGMDWTPEMLPVDFYLNGEYQGVYNLVENKEVAHNKVDIDVNAGDYLLEIEQSIDQPHSFKTAQARIPIQFEEPENPTSDQIAYVRNYVDNFESALFSDNFTDPETGYRRYIDVRSFVNNYIAQELSKNVDGNLRKSTPLTLERERGLCLYFLWDFDLAFGNADYFDSEFPGSTSGPEGWFVKDFGLDGYGTGWYPRLFQDPWFVGQVKARWNEVFPELEALLPLIDGLVKSLHDGPERNFKKWDILTHHVWPNVTVPGTYQGEIEYLKNFYKTRLAWLNTAINELETSYEED